MVAARCASSHETMTLTENVGIQPTPGVGNVSACSTPVGTEAANRRSAIRRGTIAMLPPTIPVGSLQVRHSSAGTASKG